LPEVQETLGRGNIATTGGYLHARPGSSSGLRLDGFPPIPRSRVEIGAVARQVGFKLLSYGILTRIF